jgi:hypothetical protein
MKCDCGNELPAENEQRVCAYQVDPGVVPDYQGAIFCSCCDKCRAECHAALIDQNYYDDK